MDDHVQMDRNEKSDQWSKLCTKAVVQDLADKVGCLDMETHAKFLERKQEYEDAVNRVKDVEEKLAKSLEEFLRGTSRIFLIFLIFLSLRMLIFLIIFLSLSIFFFP